MFRVSSEVLDLLFALELLFSNSVVSESLSPRGLQHARLSLKVHHQLSEFAQTHVHQVSGTIQPFYLFVVSFSPCLQYFPASVSFPRSQVFSSGGQSIGVSASASVLPMNIQG